MNIKWLGQKSHLDTNNMQVEWLGAEDTKQEVRGLSVGGREACDFRMKNRVTCDLRCLIVWLSNGASPEIKNKFPYFLSCFFGFPKNHISVGS